MMYETILYNVSDCICTITLNRPEKLNAWTRQMHLDLKDAMQTAGADRNVRVIILTGAGRGFCAGADMGSLQAIGSGTAASAQVERQTAAGRDLPGGSTFADFHMTYPTSRPSQSSSSLRSMGLRLAWASSFRSMPISVSQLRRRCSRHPLPSAA